MFSISKWAKCTKPFCAPNTRNYFNYDNVMFKFHNYATSYKDYNYVHIYTASQRRILKHTIETTHEYISFIYKYEQQNY